MLAGLIYVAAATVVTRFCCAEDKPMTGEGGRERRKAERRLHEKSRQMKRKKKPIKFGEQYGICLCLCGSENPL